MYSSIQWEVSPVLAAISTLLTAVSLLICIVTYRIQSAEPPST
jgi:putative spermidine/putrescine transport system permease protein